MRMVDMLLAVSGEIAVVCRHHGIRRLSVFGSALRDELRADSDLDLLVEFEPGRVPGLLTIAGIELELQALFGREVELRTYHDLSQHFRDDVARQAREIYAAA